MIIKKNDIDFVIIIEVETIKWNANKTSLWHSHKTEKSTKGQTTLIQG